jgi:NADPH:quinone reductase-like Zn-dependent oxidoreductase
MKAAVIKQYGVTDSIKIEEVKKPEIKPSQVLVKVLNSSINYADHAMLTGSPFLVRFSSGLFKPKRPIIGMDIAGVVEAVGEQVKDFSVGDRVFGDLSATGMGAYGEYVAAEAEALVTIPENVSFEWAAATPLAGVTALQGLRNVGKLKAGQKLLVNGASGGVGSFAIQIGKAMGAHVTAICHQSKVDAISLLKPDAIIDYTVVDVTKTQEKYDLIFDCAAYKPAKAYESNLLQNGIYIWNGGAIKHLLKVAIFGKTMSKKEGKLYTNYLAKASASDLKVVAEYMEAGLVKPLIDKVYPLQELEEAFIYYKSRKVCGKIVVANQ